MVKDLIDETPMNKQRFLSILKRELSKHEWAQDLVRFERAIQEAEKTLNGSRSCALSASWVLAWKEIGMKGKPTYKGLHAMPEGEVL